MLLPPLLSFLVDVEYEFARRSREAEVLVFDLADVAKVLAQFEHSLEVLVFDLDASLEATVQFEQGTKAIELMLGLCLHLCLDNSFLAFGRAGAVALSSNMVVTSPYQLVSSVAGGYYESLCDTLPQPMILTSSWRSVAI